MSEVGFAEVRRRLFECYRAGDYAGAMEIARSAAGDLPEHEDRTTYWIACLHALTGDADGALDVLTRGLQRGLWWAPEMLRTDQTWLRCATTAGIASAQNCADSSGGSSYGSMTWRLLTTST